MFVLELCRVIPAGTVEHFPHELRGPFNVWNVRSVQGTDGTYDNWRRAHERLASEIVFECADPKLPARVPTKGLTCGIEAAMGQNIVFLGNGEEIYDSTESLRSVPQPLKSYWEAGRPT